MSHWSLVTGISILAALAAHAQSPTPPPSGQAFLDRYCVTCHNQRLKTGGLDQLNFERTGEQPDIWEKVVRKLRAGMMPPSGAPRPDRATIDAFATSLETVLDRAAAARPNPGATALHRLNRTEYAHAVHDLLAVDLDATALLPADDSSEGFDNVADVLKVSPSLMDRYVSAAAAISRVAMGDPAVGASTTTYRVASGDGTGELPIGATNGIVARHDFPVDGIYSFKVKGGGGVPYDNRVSKVEVTVNGEVVKVVDVGYYVTADFQLAMKAGLQSVGFTLADKDPQPVDHTWKVVPGTVGVTSVAVAGPLKVTGPGDTPSRRKILVCQPASSSEEVTCATRILSALARRAYRGPATDADMETLLGFYQRGRNRGSFESGIEFAIQRLLVSPRFIFRFEEEPADLPAGAVYRIADLELASRLSFFLWSSIPDDQLLDAAQQGKLHDPAILAQQTNRMLEDPRSEALVTNFAAQWLYLREVKNAPAPVNGELRRAFQRETEMFVDSILRGERSVLDLLNADYTFVNERLARHYGIPNIYGDRFRRVVWKDNARRGLLGQSSILLVTSVADRTSPVTRGKWILENLMGTAVPVPPPNVPALEDSAGKVEPRSVRQQMEVHRRNAVCASCHKIMDPIGLSLENFDLTGKWRDSDQGIAIDASGQLVDGTALNGPASLRQALLSRSDVFVTTLTEKLMTFGLGRGVGAADMPEVRSIVHRAAQNDYRFSSLVFGIVNSPQFQMRVKNVHL